MTDLDKSLCGLQDDGSYWHEDARHCVRDREGTWGTWRFLDSFDVEWLTFRGPEPHLKADQVPLAAWIECRRLHD